MEITDNKMSTGQISLDESKKLKRKQKAQTSQTSESKTKVATTPKREKNFEITQIETPHQSDAFFLNNISYLNQAR